MNDIGLGSPQMKSCESLHSDARRREATLWWPWGGQSDRRVPAEGVSRGEESAEGY